MILPAEVKLEKIAEQVMNERGFLTDFPQEVVAEIDSIDSPEKPTPTYLDLRHLFWISIDNDDSEDLDQLTYVEVDKAGKTMVYVAVADVDGLVKVNSAIDRYAAHNTTSIYTPARIFPMLPPKLSTNLTSLNYDQERTAVVIQMEVARDGSFTLRDISLAIVKNHAKLAYNQVSDWLEGKNRASFPSTDLYDQLKLQERTAQSIQFYRDRQGALSFTVVEVNPVLTGTTVKLEPEAYNRAKAIISNLMIVANVGMTHYLTEKKLPTLRRIVKTPKRWDRIVSLAHEHGYRLPDAPDVKALQKFLIHQKSRNSAQFPDLSLAVIKLIGKGEYVVNMPGEPSEGHFDLALSEYAHTTAPNRRFPDLIMQRLLKSHFLGNPLPYTPQELITLARHCTEKEDDAAKVERRVNKSATALAISHLIGTEFHAIVTGATNRGTWVRIRKPPVEGKLIKGFEQVDVGDKITVKLVVVDILNGFIDFERVIRYSQDDL